MNQAINAKEKSDISQAIESARIDILGATAGNIGEDVSEEQTKEILEKYFNDVPEYLIDLTQEVTTKSGYKVKLSEILKEISLKYNYSFITITANGSGDIQFLSTKYDDTMLDYVSVDGTSITPAKSYNFATGGDHTIVLKWNDPTSVTSMYCMFYGCSSLTSLDLSNFDTSNVTNMSGMFSNCTGLTSLDLSNFDTSNVTNMSGMFNKCSSLTSLDLSNFNFSSVIDYLRMFNNVPNNIAIKSSSTACSWIATNTDIPASATYIYTQ